MQEWNGPLPMPNSAKNSLNGLQLVLNFKRQSLAVAEQMDEKSSSVFHFVSLSGR